MTKNVYSIVEEVKKNYNGSYAKYKEKHKNDETNLIYWEHITPNEIVWQRVVDVFDNYNKSSFTYDELRAKIKDCFYGHRLILITKAEQIKLDKIGGRTGERVNGMDNINNIKSRNIAEKRIQLLFEQCGVDSLYFNGKTLEEKDLFDYDGNFINEVKEYFAECNFSIE